MVTRGQQFPSFSEQMRAEQNKSMSEHADRLQKTKAANRNVRTSTKLGPTGNMDSENYYS